jgi:hypothetical protein
MSEKAVRTPTPNQTIIDNLQNETDILQTSLSEKERLLIIKENQLLGDSTLSRLTVGVLIDCELGWVVCFSTCCGLDRICCARKCGVDPHKPV